MKPNILHIVDSFEPGGTERQAIQLVRLLKDRGRYRIHLATLQKRGLLLADAEALNLGEIAEYPLNNFYDPNFVKQLRRLVRFLQEKEISVVHSHDFYTNVFGMTAAAIARVPARVASKRETEGFRTSLQKRAERVVYSLAHMVIVNAEAVGKQLREGGVPAVKIEVVYNGLDMRRVTPASGLPRDEVFTLLGLPKQQERRLVTIVANIQHEVKDHPTFLRAAARVRVSYPQAAFVIAGEGKLVDRLRQVAATLGLERDVFFVGRCDRVGDLLAVSDVCVLSSKAEGFSNSILEYMAAARPVVVTNVGGAREAVIEGETGHMVQPGDDETMAARIIDLLREPRRASKMGERGRSVVERKFSCEAQVDRTLAVYDRLLTQPVLKPEAIVSGLRRERA